MNDLSSFKVLEPNNLLSDLVTFINSQIDNFPNSQEFIDVLEKKTNENQHSLSFCLYMTNRNRDFYFARENSQKGSSVIDVGVYKGSQLIFTIEAKVLPTPAGATSSPRDVHEYVYGRGGGIQRFKDGKHGVDNLDNALPENGMIAYLKENDFAFWQSQINQWINDAGWGNEEQLVLRNVTVGNRLISKHKTCYGTDVLLHHFWIDVSSSNR